MGAPWIRIEVERKVLLIFITLLALPGLSRAQSTPVDANTLLEFRQAVIDPERSLVNWNSSRSVCQWTGVQCRNGTSQVARLTLPSMSLQGFISPAIGRLASLETLDLSRNDLTGPIPESITNCTMLTDVNLSENDLNGSLPQDLGLLVNLTMLRLQQNRLQGQIPSSIGSLKQLERLRLHNNQLTGSIPKDIGNCSRLRILELAENQLDGIIPLELGRLTRLTHLSLFRNHISGGIPREIGGCTSLRRVSLSYNPLGGELVNELGNLARLRNFDASNCSLSGDFPEPIGNITRLESLDVSNNRISGLIPEGAGRNWKQLKILNFSRNSFTGEISSSFGELTGLQSLNLSFNNFTGVLPSSIGLLPNLSELILSSNSFEGQIPPALGNSSSLSKFNASNNRFSGSIPSALCAKNNLTMTSLSNNNLTGSIRSLLEACPSLETFEAANNRFSGGLPSTLASTSLVRLDLSSNQLTGAIPAQIGQLSNLQHLLLSDNLLDGTIPDTGMLGKLAVLDLSQNTLSGPFPSIFVLSELQTLDLSHNNLTGPIPQEIGNTLSELEVLDLSNNNFSGSIPGIKAFRDGPPNAFLNNPGLCGAPLDSCTPSPGPPPPRKGLGRRRRRAGRIVGLVFIVIGGLVLSLGAIFLFCTHTAIRRKQQSAKVQENKFADRVPMMYAETEKATEGFSPANVIGEGPHGTVYKAIYAWEKILAVKVLHTQPEIDDKGRYYFNSAARKLSRIHHPNVVKLEGFIIYGGSRLFLYEYMPNRSLGEVLHAPSGPKLHWNTRYKIAVGAAQGLAYLHHQCSIIHCNIKSRNIMLDSAFGAHIGDMALAKLTKDPKSLSAVDRSSGYVAPEATKVSLKADVYSFGIMLLELLTGRKPILEDGRPLGTFVRNCLAEDQPLSDILDSILRNANGPFHEEMSTVCKVALACTDPLPNRRPSMKEVADILSQVRREPGGPKLRSLRSFIHSRSFILLRSYDDES